jgi:hypothetical protein
VIRLLITIYLCKLDLLLQEAKFGVRSKVLAETGLAHPDAVLHSNRDKL